MRRSERSFRHAWAEPITGDRRSVSRRGSWAPPESGYWGFSFGMSDTMSLSGGDGPVGPATLDIDAIGACHAARGLADRDSGCRSDRSRACRGTASTGRPAERMTRAAVESLSVRPMAPTALTPMTTRSAPISNAIRVISVAGVPATTRTRMSVVVRASMGTAPCRRCQASRCRRRLYSGAVLLACRSAPIGCGET